MSKEEYFVVMKRRNFYWKEGTIIKGYQSVCNSYILGGYASDKTKRDEYLEKKYIIRITKKALIERFLRSVV